MSGANRLVRSLNQRRNAECNSAIQQWGNIFDISVEVAAVNLAKIPEKQRALGAPNYTRRAQAFGIAARNS